MCVICKGDDKFPTTLPRPVLSALPLAVPLACAEPADPQIEGRRLMTLLNMDEFRVCAAEEGLAEAEETQAQLMRAVTMLDSLALKLFSNACKMERNARALDLAVQLQLPKSLAGALKLANHFKLGPLADRITKLMQAKYDDLEVEEDIEMPPPRQPARARSLAPPAPAPAAQPEPEQAAAPEEDADDEDAAEEADSEPDEPDEAPAARPSANPFARASGPSKSVLEAGAKSALKHSTPSTANKNGAKRKGVTAPLGKKMLKTK